MVMVYGLDALGMVVVYWEENRSKNGLASAERCLLVSKLTVKRGAFSNFQQKHNIISISLNCNIIIVRARGR